MSDIVLRTWTLWSRLLSRQSPLQQRVSISVPAPSLPPWALASRSLLPSICNLIRFTPGFERIREFYIAYST